MNSNRRGMNGNGRISNEELLQGLKDGKYSRAEVVLNQRHGGSLIIAYDGNDLMVHSAARHSFLEELKSYVSMQLELPLDSTKSNSGGK